MRHAPSKRRRSLRLLSLLLGLAMLSGLLPAAAAEPAEPQITADSAIVIDYDTGEALYEKDADTMRVPASMTKVMTAYIIFEELEAGDLTLDTLVPISDFAADISRNQARYPTAVPLPYGGSLTVDTLLKLILLPSASASCVAMAEYIAGTEAAFVQRMNETAQRLGMTAQYENCHGAHVHYLTARSQAILVRECISRFPQMLEYTSMTSMTFDGETYPNTNQLLPGAAFEYEGADGFKTGTINAAGYCLSATAVRDGRRIISVVMHADDNTTRHTDSIALLDYGFAKLAADASYADAAFHWSWQAVEELDALGVELHPVDGLFRPYEAVTRAEFTAMLYTALEETGALPAAGDGAAPAFTDVSGHWAEEYIQSAAELGLVDGTGGACFNPDRAISRQEMMVLTDRFIELPDLNGLGFDDDQSIAVWALPAAARTTAVGLFTGTDGLLRPAATATRAEAAQVVCRVLDRVGS